VKPPTDALSKLVGAAGVADDRGLSLQHIGCTNEASASRMAERGTVAALLPDASHFLRETQLPRIDAQRRHHVAMAVNTDLNPGASPLMSLRMAMNLACTLFRLTSEEALRGATVNSAKALGLVDPGRLVEGMRADVAVWGVTVPAELSCWMRKISLSAQYVQP
jgi:imidazolonepropionase